MKKMGCLFKIIIFLWLSLFGSYLAQACSIALPINEDSKRVLVIGQIVGYVLEIRGPELLFGSTFSETQLIHGVEIKPFKEFRQGSSTTNGNYRVFPSGLGGGCEPYYYLSTQSIADQYPSGQTVTIVGYVSQSKYPGNLRLNHGMGLNLVGSECSPARLEELKQGITSPEHQCGDYYFHLLKEIMLLPNVGEEERYTILARMAGTIAYIYEYESLVSKYVASAIQREELLLARYSKVMDNSCEKKPKLVKSPLGELDSISRKSLISAFKKEGFRKRYELFKQHNQYRTRWTEYCTRTPLNNGR